MPEASSPLGTWFTKQFGGIFNRNRVDVEKRGGDALQDLPLPFNSYVSMVGQNEKTPLYRWSYRWIMDMFYGSDVLRTIIKTITDEAFKNSYKVSPKFNSKCIECGKEFMEDVKRCPVCGGYTRKPNEDEKDIFEEFAQEKNRFGEALFPVMRSADTDLNTFDNAFILIAKRYKYNANNIIIGAEIHDVVRLAPDKIMMVMSNYGMGRNDTGQYSYFCPEHREELRLFAEEGVYRCPTCGRALLEAWFASSNAGTTGGSTTGQQIYYGKNEILHLRRWTNTEGYGVSPLYSVWRKVLTLIKMDELIMEAYSMERSPHTLMVIRGKVDNVRQSFLWMMQKARENPNMVYPLIIEGDATNTRRIVETVNLDLKPQEMQMMDMVEQYRQFIGLVYGVSPIFSTGAAGQGLTNEGLQITVTNRTIAETQRVWNEFLRWLTSQLGIFDFKVELSRNELQDDMSKLSVERERVAIARQMVDLGFDVDMETLTDGTMNFRYKKIGKARSGGGGGGALSMPPAQGGEGVSIQPDQRGGMIPENTEEPEAETEGEGA